MAPPRLSRETKRLRGTFVATREPSAMAGRYRLTEPVPPPDGMDRETQREWILHMSLAVAAGTLSATDLRSFAAMVEAAVLSARGFRAALKSGPIIQGERGCKTAPQWTAWMAASNVYRQWCAAFGLTPMAARQVPMLPPAKGTALREVG
jgi:hypothetical protein